MGDSRTITRMKGGNMEDKKETKEDYNLVEVPTGKAIAIQTKDGELWSNEYAIVYLLNEVSALKKLVKG